MKKVIIAGTLLLTHLCTFANAKTIGSTLKYRPEYCKEQVKEEPILYATDVSYSNSKEELMEDWSKVYYSGKRLEHRAFVKEGQVYGKVSLYNDTEYFKLPSYFVENIKVHIEEALKKRLVDAIYFPDMGHSHFYIPMKDYQEKIAGKKSRGETFKLIAENKDIKVVYHTAEKLNTLSNPDFNNSHYLRWRYYTRNLLGQNNGNKAVEIMAVHDLFTTGRPNKIGNTIGQSDMPTHRWYAGFNLSASKDGCFEYTYQNKSYYFDISYSDLPYPAGTDLGY